MAVRHFGIKQRVLQNRAKHRKAAIQMNAAWCTLLLHPKRFFLTLFHTIKTTCICHVHGVSTQHIQSFDDFFSITFSGHFLCVKYWTWISFKLPVLRQSQAWKISEIYKEAFEFNQASQLLFWLRTSNPQTTQTLGWSVRYKHITTYVLIGVKRPVNLKTTRKTSVMHFCILPAFFIPLCQSLTSLWIPQWRKGKSGKIK